MYSGDSQEHKLDLRLSIMQLGYWEEYLILI